MLAVWQAESYQKTIANRMPSPLSFHSPEVQASKVASKVAFEFQ